MGESKNKTLNEFYLQLIRDDEVYLSGLHESTAIITRHCARALSANRAGVWLLTEDQSQLYCQSLCIDDEDNPDKSLVLSVDNAPVYLHSLYNNRVIGASDALTDKRTQELAFNYLIPNDIRSVLEATLSLRGVAKGVLRIEMTGAQRKWTQAEKMFVASAADLIVHRLIVDQLAKSEAKHKALFEATNDGIMVFSGPTFTDVNPAACDIFGAEPEDIIGKTPADFSPEFQNDGQRSADKAFKHIQQCMQGEPQNFEWTHLRLDQTPFCAEVTLNAVRLEEEDTLFAIVRDISHRKEAEHKAQLVQAEIEYRAAHDSLTGLLNREQLHLYVNDLIKQAQEPEHSAYKIALLLFDLNRFKEINDTLGHSTGDQVLVNLADLLKGPIEAAGGHLFRLGGDEFVAVFDNQNCHTPFRELEYILTRNLKTTLNLDDISVEMSASIGIALYPNNGNDSHELLRCADVAMYHAKGADNTSSWYEPANDLNNKRRLAMMLELGCAIRDNELVLFYQPRINIHTGEVTGCEALLRWQHAELGLVPPNEFIPLAEMTDLIHPLSNWVLNSVLTQIKHLQAKGYDVPIAMNVSTRNLTDSQLVDTLENLITTQNTESRFLEIEITESALMNHPARVLQNLDRLDKLGLSIAIDDFGTGYSSLSYLKKLPLDTLKIDQSFVNDMLDDESDSLIVDSTISLAHNFSLTVVAEGVENQATLDALAAKNCDQAQGYYIARPMCAEKFEQWLDTYNESEFTSKLAA